MFYSKYRLACHPKPKRSKIWNFQMYNILYKYAIYTDVCKTTIFIYHISVKNNVIYRNICRYQNTIVYIKHKSSIRIGRLYLRVSFSVEYEFQAHIWQKSKKLKSIGTVMGFVQMVFRSCHNIIPEHFLSFYWFLDHY